MVRVPGPRLVAVGAVAALGLGIGVAAVLAGGEEATAEPTTAATSAPVESAPTPGAPVAGTSEAASPEAASPEPVATTAEPDPVTAPEEPVATTPVAPDVVGGAGPDCGGPDSYEPPREQEVYFFTSTPGEGDGSNGRIPASDMTALTWCVDSRGNSQWLRADAAAALIDLNTAFAAQFGENIAIDLSYRSFEDQSAMRDHYGSLAARPGTSNHGWGTAFDTWEWAAYGFGTERHQWLVTHGPDHGWVAPAWAREDGSNPEYWHFEYVG